MQKATTMFFRHSGCFLRKLQHLGMMKSQIEGMLYSKKMYNEY